MKTGKRINHRSYHIICNHSGILIRLRNCHDKYDIIILPNEFRNNIMNIILTKLRNAGRISDEIKK